MEIDDPQLAEFLDRLREKGVEPVSIDPLTGDNGVFGVETELTINDESFTGEVDYEVKNNGIRYFFLEIYLDEDDERKPVLDESSAGEIDHLLYEYKPEREEIEDTLEVLEDAYSEVYE
ncbi:hypothetical protein [Halohasta salina]|uniref:hypothetical protein n=1 Tax=Halohasta salina TaxID=2961621 RepID=UPI0020A463D7|nr:hypothetical protein [Halohasta salina]